MITHQSPSKNCKFIFPILAEVDLLLDYNGLLWRVELSKIDSLSDFSDACTGFAIDIFEGNGNTFIVITTKEFTLEEHIEIMFESRLQDEFPCAFYDEYSKEYDDFSIPIDAQGLSLSVDSNDYMIITTMDYEEDDWSNIDFDDEEEEYQIPISVSNSELKPISSNPSQNIEDDEQIKDLEERLDNAIAECEELRDEVAKLEAERERLLSKLKNKSELLSLQGIEEVAKEELERLKTLISQLVDKDYSGDYIKTADEQINELTQKITDQKAIKKEKEDSLKLLKTEYVETEAKNKDITAEITHTMELLHKAESIQRESSTELSVFQKRLNDILNELQIDISTLEMYETQDGIDSLLLEANDMKNRIETKLKALISSRQKDNTNRFNNVTS